MPYFSDVATALGNFPNTQVAGRTYDNPFLGGYTPEHQFFGPESNKWHGKTVPLRFLPPRNLPPRNLPVKGTSIISDIAVRVSMGTILPGGRNIKTIGVSGFANNIEVLCADTYTQTVVDGLDKLDPHIGATVLHHRCYNLLHRRWLEWSGGYQVAIENTTLRGTKIHAAIAGKDLSEPPKERDAILHFFLKPRGKTNEVVFKPGQIELALVIGEMDYKLALEKREEAYEQTEDGITLRSKVCKLNLHY
jgi:hypothetical protein